MGPPGQKYVEGYRKGMRVETPEGPPARLLWKEEATGTVLAFLRNTGVGRTVTLRPLEEEKGEE